MIISKTNHKWLLIYSFFTLIFVSLFFKQIKNKINKYTELFTQDGIKIETRPKVSIVANSSTFTNNDQNAKIKIVDEKIKDNELKVRNLVKKNNDLANLMIKFDKDLKNMENERIKKYDELLEYKKKYNY
jgi:hypothetical protein